MTTNPESSSRGAVGKFLAEHGLTDDTHLFRETVRQSLIATGVAGTYRLAANANPSEAVVDVYGQGYLVQAEQVGPGLAFAQSAAPDWQETMEMRVLQARRSAEGSPVDRVQVEVRLGDILEQGGLIYPIESVTVEKAWYCTMPAGSVEVREVP
jgi:hypothetical protein